MKIRNIIFVLLIVCGVSFPQISKKRLNSNFVKVENKRLYLQSLNGQIDSLFSVEKKEIDESAWEKLLYEVGVDLYRSPKIHDALGFIFSKIDSVSPRLSVRGILTARALYPQEFTNEIATLFAKTQRHKTALYAFHYLFFANRTEYVPLLDSLQKRFPKRTLLDKLTNQFVNEEPQFFNRKELKEIFSPEFLKNELIIFTVFRHDRKLPGLTIIRKPDGNFLELGDSLWSIPQLGYSVTDFPYYLIDGNTPQGLYAFRGFYKSKKKSIGPTPIPIIRLPYEIPASDFFKNDSVQQWNINSYKNMFPETLRKNKSVYESYYAGKLGRKLLVMHGSTDNPDFYKDEPYFPLTPSTGCLTSYEKWDEQNGKLLESDQLKLVNAILSTGKRNGYLFVFEIDDKPVPVTKKEIEEIIESSRK